MTQQQGVLPLVFVICVTIALGSLCASAPQAGESPTYPSHKLKNKHLEAFVYLPDASAGYYRGTRFDWSGIVARVETKKHKFFGPWRPTHDPLFHDHADGTAEEFSYEGPLGYDEAKPGETFVKIGIGELVKTDDKPYRFHGRYRIARPGEWKITRQPDSIRFEQDLTTAKGWGYRYEKTVRLDPKAPRMHIERTLQNIGKRTIDTTHYGHNFVILDDEPAVGPIYRVTFGYETRPEVFRDGGIATFDGRRIRFDRSLRRDESIYGRFGGTKATQELIAVIEHEKTGARVTIRGDQPLEKLAFYAANPAVCPEPFVRLRLNPGEKKSWKTIYEFGDNGGSCRVVPSHSRPVRRSGGSG